MVKEFHLKQKFNLVSDNYTVSLNGRMVYQIKGNGFSWGNQASFQTMDGTKLCCMKQTNKTTLTPWNNYEWFKDGGKLWATAKQADWGLYEENEFGMPKSNEDWVVASKKEINIDIPGENDYKITGKAMSWNFIIWKGGTKVGEINKKWGLTDNYGVRVEDGADEVDVLMCAILVDATYYDDDGI